MTRKRYLCIKNFDELQHYKDRNPIWIKTPCGLLDDYDFTQLPDAVRFHALALMLLAARVNNRLPDDAAWLSRRINSSEEINLQLLLETGFLEVLDEGGEGGGGSESVEETKNEADESPSESSVQQEKKSASATSKVVYTPENIALEQNRTEQKRKEQNTTQQNKTEQNTPHHNRTEQTRDASAYDAAAVAEEKENGAAAAAVAGGCLDSFENRTRPDPELPQSFGGGGDESASPGNSKPENAEEAAKVRAVSELAPPAPHSNNSLPPTSNEAHASQFSLDDCVKYARLCQSRGEPIRSVQGLANHLHRTGSADASIRAEFYPEQQKQAEEEIYGAPREFTDEPCLVCYGAKMEEVKGKGSRRCPHCLDEQGKPTGREPANCPDHPPHETDAFYPDEALSPPDESSAAANAPNSVIPGDFLKSLTTKLSLPNTAELADDG